MSPLAANIGEMAGVLGLRSHINRKEEAQLLGESFGERGRNGKRKIRREVDG